MVENKTCHNYRTFTFTNCKNQSWFSKIVPFLIFRMERPRSQEAFLEPDAEA